MMRKSLNENQIRTALSALNAIYELPYDEQLKLLGSIGAEEAHKLRSTLETWYNHDVCGMAYDDEYGWYNPADMTF